MLTLYRKLIDDYGWIHLSIGIAGHFCFFLGSVFFLWEKLKRAGVWLFIIGAGAMFIGKVGSALVERRTSHQQKQQSA